MGYKGAVTFYEFRILTIRLWKNIPYTDPVGKNVNKSNRIGSILTNL